METATYFRALLETIDDISAWINQPRSRLHRRRRQFLKFATYILDDLADGGWTFITDDSATLPRCGDPVLVALHYGWFQRTLVSDAYRHGVAWFFDEDCEREIEGSGDDLTVYAWRPWPTPPPLPEEHGE